MRKIKTTVAVLSALLLLALLAVMPQAAARISDLLGNEKPGAAPMRAVELAVGTDKTDKPGYMMRKLVLEKRMVSLPIQPEQASMTEEEVYAAALDGMAAYREANIFSWFKYDFRSAEAYLGIDPEDKNNNMVFWAVTFSSQVEPYRHLFLHIDDETGKILYIVFDTYGEDPYVYSDSESRQRMMEELTDSFFDALNLSQRDEYEALLGEGVSQPQVGEDFLCTHYTFVVSEYGVIDIEFIIYPGGFYVYFPA